jgi:hypothetical protein
MTQRSVWQRLAVGVAAGLAGTVAIQGLQAVGRHVRPQSMPPLQPASTNALVDITYGQESPPRRSQMALQAR